MLTHAKMNIAPNAPTTSTLGRGDAAATLFPAKDCFTCGPAVPRLDLHTLNEIESYVEPIYRLADSDLSAALAPATLSMKLLGTRPKMVPLASQGTIAHVKGQWRIYIRCGTPWPRARWIAGHELAHWWFKRIGYAGPDLEARCDALGAALIVPRPVLVQVHSKLGDNVHAIADELKTTQSLALLRVSEVTGRPGAVLRRDAPPIVRGEPCSHMPLEYGKPICNPAVKRVAITDEKRRTGIVAA